VKAIHYIGDFTYFSNRKTTGKYEDVIHALRSHIRYIAGMNRRTGRENVITVNLDIQRWIEKAKEEVKKRWDSRVAVKFVMALPVDADKENAERWAETVREFVSETLNVNGEDVSVAVHLDKGISGDYNPHVHVLVFPRNRNGKKLRLGKRELSRFHRKWDEKLKEMGYEVVKEEGIKLPHLGERIHYDEEAKTAYELLRETKKLTRRIEAIERYRSKSQVSEEKGEEGTFEIERGSLMQRIVERLSGYRAKQKREVEKHFRRLGYDDGDKVAVVLVNHKTGDVKQRVMTVGEVKSDKVLGYLSYMNANGYSVYVSVNVLKENAKRRRREDFKELQRRIYLDLDAKGRTAREMISELYRYLKLRGLPEPTHIVKSSRGNYQVYWVLKEDVERVKLERIMRRMNDDLGLDYTQDVSRVFRLPWFRNKKPGKNDLVVNVDELTVEGDKVIRATGEEVEVERFMKLYDEEVEFSKEVREELERQRAKLERQRAKTEKVSDLEEYKRLMIETAERFKDKVKEFREFFEEFKEIVEIAYERSKGKTPSEMDMSTVGLVYSRYNGNPPIGLVILTRTVLLSLARKRKDNPEDYVNRTMEKVYRSWHFPPSKPLSEPLGPSPYEEPSDSFRSSFRLRLR
jgi:hypothetical protein